MVSVLASSAVDRGFIGGVMVSVLASSAVDRGFIGGVTVSVLASSAVDRGFIGGVMVSVLAWSAVDRGFEPQSVQTKHYKMGICCFSATNAKIGWLGIRIMCPSGAIFLPSDCCFRELVLYKSNSLCWSRTKRTSSSFH